MEEALLSIIKFEVCALCDESIEGKFIMNCFNCEEKYHGSCVNITPYEGIYISKYFCLECREEDDSLATVFRPNLKALPKVLPKCSLCKEFCAGNITIYCADCSNSYHEDCAGSSPSISKKLSKFYCEICVLKGVRKKSVFAGHPDQQRWLPLACRICDLACDENMVMYCLQCKGNFHNECLGIKEDEAKFIRVYYCRICKKNNPGLVYKITTQPDEFAWVPAFLTEDGEVLQYPDYSTD